MNIVQQNQAASQSQTGFYSWFQMPCGTSGTAVKKYLIIILAFICLFSIKINAQVLIDTFNFGGYGASGGASPIVFDGTIAPNIYKSWVKYRPNELAQRGIIPGVTIYGINYHKQYSGYLYSSTQLSFEVKLRSGSMDSTIPNFVNYSHTSLFNYVHYFLFDGFTTTAIFNNGSTLNFAPTVGWLQPLMFDVPFVYTGGTLEIATVCTIPINNNIGSGYIIMSHENPLNDPLCYFSYFGDNISINSSYLQHHRPDFILYHSAFPTACMGIPNGGTVSGNTYVCKNANFTLYLNSPSAGPGITYQWQKSAMSPVNWVNIAGATNPVATTNTADTTQYRCQVTCTNSNHTAYSTTFITKPHYLHIDSVTTTIASNLVTLTGHYNDTTFAVSGKNFSDNWSTLGGLPYYPTGVPSDGSFGLTTDGTYNIYVVRDNYCGSDTVMKTITIGCAGSTTFYDSITVDHSYVCPGSGATLTILDTIPSNYINTWVYYTATTSGYIAGTGNTLTVYPTVPTTYYNAATCSLSNNIKTSNSIQITITPPPIAGTIQAINTTTNYYNFTNSGMNNAQSFTWFFGDGDSSISLAPSHHYNLAGTYNVWFVVTNAGNGCTDTAFTTVHITTGIEEVPQSKQFSVSPNPFNESFVVNCPSGKGTITVTDAVGKVVACYQLPVTRGSQLTTDHSQLKIDMKGFASGIYLIKYENDNESETIKIMKQ